MEMLTEADLSAHLRVAELLEQHQVSAAQQDVGDRNLQENMDYGWFYTNLANGNTCAAQPYYTKAYITNVCLSSPNSSVLILCHNGKIIMFHLCPCICGFNYCGFRSICRILKCNGIH